MLITPVFQGQGTDYLSFFITQAKETCSTTVSDKTNYEPESKFRTGTIRRNPQSIRDMELEAVEEVN
jgi:hypothetical protein